MRNDIGSEFERPDLDGPGHLRAWLPSEAVAVTAGRQALGLVAGELAASGVRNVLVPDHYCDSMTDPFERFMLTVVPVPTAFDTLPEPSALAAALEEVSDSAILFSESFGCTASALLATVLDDARASGHAVVVDRTHSLLAPNSYAGDYTIASLRKLLPVPDGAWVTGLVTPPVLTAHQGAKLFVELRIQAATLKRQYLNEERDDQAHRAMFERAEDLLDRLPDTCPMSDASLELLDHLDPKRLRAVRLANADRLTALLEGLAVRVVNGNGWRNSPSYVVISTRDVTGLRNHLISEAIYCPIHWPEPRRLLAGKVWRHDLLSLVIDQRYTGDDMGRMAAAIAAHLENTYPEGHR